MARPGHRGFTLIELLIVVAIIGIIAAIAIPNLINAIQRGRQKRTMGDIRTLSTAVEAYATDWAFYPKDLSDVPVTSLQSYIIPTYLRKVPARDGWNNQLMVEGVHEGRDYTVWSQGRDNVFDFTPPGGPKTDFDSDIVYSRGAFIQWPEGIQVD
jgi:type II secretion system protein G